MKINSAQRMYSVLVRAQREGGQMQMGHVLCRACGISLDMLSEPQKATLAMGVVANFRRLMDEVESSLANHSLSKGYTSYFARMREYFKAGYLEAQWSAVQQQVYVGESLSMVELMADVLPNEGQEIVTEDIFKLLSEIDALEKSFQTSALPEFHSYYAKIWLNCLKQALLDYALFGIRGMRQAIYQIDGSVIEMQANKEKLENEASTMTPEQNEFFSKLYKKYGEVAEHAKKLYYLTNVATMIGKGVEQLSLPWTKL